MRASLPFTFSLLPSSTTKPSETLELISNLTPHRLPLSPPTPARDGDLPDWVAKLASAKGATFAWKVMEKEIFASDINEQQNRFMIRSQVITDRIMPEMTGEEMAAANLMAGNFPVKRQRFYGGGEVREKKRGRDHGGLEVMVYDRKGWGCLLCLIRWDAGKSSVLKGSNYREFLRRSHLVAGDKVEMWGFRGEDEELFFAIGNKFDLELSL